MVNFKDDKWKKAVEYHKYPEGIWAKRVPIFDKPMTNPWWIWSDTNVQGGKIDTPVYFRLTFGDLSVEPANKVAVRWGQLRAGIKLNISNSITTSAYLKIGIFDYRPRQTGLATGGNRKDLVPAVFS